MTVSATYESDRKTGARRDLVVAGLVHVLHDGYTDLLYVLLPIWQKEYALSYAALAGMRALYYGTMALAQVPGQRMFGRLGAPVLLVGGTVLAALGFVIAGLTTSLVGLCIGLTVSGLGSSTQHPNGSALVTNAYGAAAKGPLGLYNFAGDAGKAIFPAATSLLLLALSWRLTLLVIAAVGLAAAVTIFVALPRGAGAPLADKTEGHAEGARHGFSILFVIGALDTACRMGYLLFLPFILSAAGARDATIGIALSLVFVGGAFGKAVCGWLGDRLGLLGTVALTEVATMILVLATLAMPLPALLVTLPVLGLMINGTSSVLYGTVPFFAGPGGAAHKFAVFYTGVIGAGAFAPIVYGALADAAGRTLATEAAALTALAAVPLTAWLRREMERTASA